jgi:hypothetical protein
MRVRGIFCVTQRLKPVLTNDTVIAAVNRCATQNHLLHASEVESEPGPVIEPGGIKREARAFQHLANH